MRKDAEPETLVAACPRGRARTGRYIDPLRSAAACRALDPGDALTAREREVLRHVALGRIEQRRSPSTLDDRRRRP